MPPQNVRAQTAVIDVNQFDAVIFDVDGVVTDTARVHAAAWKRTFDDLLRATAREAGVPMRPFDIREDYLRYVDGKPRRDGVRSFLASRGITLPEGTPGDRPGAPTVNGVAARKDRLFLGRLRRHGVLPFESTVHLLRGLREQGLGTAAVSSSRNARRVLEAAGLAGLFDVRVDGQDIIRMGLAGKPDPALFLEAARRLRLPPSRLAVVEDALAGVDAGRRGGFGLVIGVDRGSLTTDDLHRHGADVVISDVGELFLRGVRR